MTPPKRRVMRKCCFELSIDADKKLMEIIYMLSAKVENCAPRSQIFALEYAIHHAHAALKKVTEGDNNGGE